MTISTLERTSLDEIVSTFNRAFADYRMRVNFNEDSFKMKICSENISLHHSVGAFSGGRLIGFILNGFDFIDNCKAVYNAGTGVIPSFRGQKVTQKLHEYIVPLFYKQNFQKGYLEVLDTNTNAIHIYLKVGYQIERDLASFQGVVYYNKLPVVKDVYAQLINEIDWDVLPAFWNFRPSWQNNKAAIQRSLDQYKIIGVFCRDNLIGYGIVNPGNGKVVQFGVDKAFRNMGVGKYLFGCMGKIAKSKLSVYNIDESDLSTIQFLKKIGLTSTINQYEMRISFNSEKAQKENVHQAVLPNP